MDRQQSPCLRVGNNYLRNASEIVLLHLKQLQLTVDSSNFSYSRTLQLILKAHVECMYPTARASHFRFAHSLPGQNIQLSDTFRRPFHDASSNRATAYAK